MARIIVPIMIFVVLPLACEPTQPSNYDTSEIDTGTDSAQIDTSSSTETETNTSSDTGLDTTSDVPGDTETEPNIDPSGEGQPCTVQADCAIPTPFCINQTCYACSSADRYRCDQEGECSDLMTDVNHCGECGNACTDATPACSLGECLFLTELNNGVAVTLPAGRYAIYTSGLTTTFGTLTVASPTSETATLIVGSDSSTKTGYWMQFTKVENDHIATLILEGEVTVTFGP